MSKRWYVVHAYSGFEAHVKRSLEERIERSGMQDLFGEILVPTEEVVEMRAGAQRRSERKFFPGYVLVQMELDDDTWHMVKDVPKVMGFIGGSGDRPAPISDTPLRRRIGPWGAVTGTRMGGLQVSPPSTVFQTPLPGPGFGSRHLRRIRSHMDAYRVRGFVGSMARSTAPVKSSK